MKPISAVQSDIKIFAAVTAASAVAFMVALSLFFMPALKSHFALSAKLKEKKADLDKISMNIKNYGLMEAEIKDLQDTLNKKKNRLFWEMGIGGFLNEITQMAADLPIEFVSITPQSPLMPGNQEEVEKNALSSYKEVPILVELNGTYPSLIQFLTKLEGADKSIAVKKLEVASGTKDIFKRTIRITLMIFSKTA